jgi:hypothetical protein
MKSVDTSKWVSYCPETGTFTYKSATPDMFENGKRHMTSEVRCGVWNTKNEGRVAGTIDSQGYTVISVGSRQCKAHRLAFVLMTGSEPKGQVDHINGNRSDNRWENLRDVPKLLNALNQKKHSTNSSGVTGVRFSTHLNKWMAYIGHQNKMHHLGVFDTLEDACEARWDAEEKLGFHQNHGRR